ncbi:MAG: hypothetical protein E5X93_15690 [Mesorhizobium sp.]|uniref:hypothetical protein n=1 Tax=Mesorhizobium sp. TaxID=1871066 RepID=UPI0011F46863|nr:hypothetical protein [Mesorhizobium sp.]TIO22751.1 MAG: hypothetical protein E5X93_15690 [Mesorhizobium sp.]
MFDFENLGQKRQAGILAKVSETSTVPVTRRHVLASSTLPFLVAFAGVRRAAGGSQDPVFQLTKAKFLIAGSRSFNACSRTKDFTLPMLMDCLARTGDYEVDLYDNADLARLAIASYSHEFGS